MQAQKRTLSCECPSLLTCSTTGSSIHVFVFSGWLLSYVYWEVVVEKERVRSRMNHSGGNCDTTPCLNSGRVDTPSLCPNCMVSRGAVTRHPVM